METGKFPDMSYTSVRKSHINKNRNSTDFIFIYFFGAFLIIWIALVIYVFSFEGNFIDKSSKIIGEDKYQQDVDYSDWLSPLIKRITGTFDLLAEDYKLGYVETIWFILSSSAVLIGFILCIKWIPYFSTFIGIFMFCMFVLNIIHRLVIHLPDLTRLHNSEILIATDFTENSLKLIIYFTVIICISIVNISPLADIIEKAIRKVLVFRSFIFFALIITLLYGLLIIFTIKIINLMSLTDPIRVFIIIGSLYISNVIISFGNMVIGEAIAIYHWSLSENDISKVTLLRCVSTVARYHFGSIVFSATVILPVILSAYIAIKYILEIATNYKLPSPIMDVFCKIFLVLSIRPFAEISIAIYGYDYLEATKKSLYLLVKNCSLTVALINVIYTIVCVITVISFALSYLIGYLISMIPIISESNDTTSIFEESSIENVCIMILSLTNVLSVPLQLFVTASVFTNLLCILEDNENDSTEKYDTTQYTALAQ